ncbi:MAG: sulfite exporter TauE/SafE family protein [Thermoplasmata archaeon]|nr:sulfite exporter TauE/SafE family protein [Thermoplasmata archaeon]
MDWSTIWLAIVALGASIINGAIGYGFSSIVTPIALLWFSNKILNPAVVSVELVVNVALLFRERAFIPATKGRALPVVMTLLPGVLLGTLGLSYLAVNDVKVVVYVMLLPMVVIQLLGLRRPFTNERRSGLAIGPGIGFLYSLTTISGPPLAVFFRNQGLSKNEFRCTLAQVRVAESSLTLTTYFLFTEFLGANLTSAPSLGLVPFLLVPVLIGVPVGTWLVARVSRDSFTRLVMGMDGLVVSFGLSQVILKLKWVGSTVSDLVFALLAAMVVALAAYSLYKLPGARKLVDSTLPGSQALVHPGNSRPVVGPPRASTGDSTEPVMEAPSHRATSPEEGGPPLPGPTLR